MDFARRRPFVSRFGPLALGLPPCFVLAIAGAASDGVPVCRGEWGDAAVHVACLGDSNTQSDWQASRPDGFPAEEGWCERLSDHVSTTNCGWGGATASPNVSPYPHFQGQGQLDAALSDPRVDLVIIALGTNDIGYSFDDPSLLLLEDQTPAAFASELEALAEQAADAGALVVVATSPYRFAPTDGQAPVPPGFNDRIAELNGELGARFGADALADFTTGFGPEDFLNDGIHLNSQGMAKRSDAALEAVLRLVPEPTRQGAPALLAIGLLACRRGAGAARRNGRGGGASRELYNLSLLRNRRGIACPPAAISASWSLPRRAACGRRTAAPSCSPSPRSC